MRALPAADRLPQDDGVMAGKLLLLLALLGTLPLASPVLAAEQGAMAAASHGEIVITVTVAAHVALSEMRTTAAQAGDDRTACLWLGTATRGYAVTAIGAPILWRTSATAAAGRIVAPATTLAHLSSPAARPDCGKNPSLFVGYEPAAAGASPATLLIAPE